MRFKLFAILTILCLAVFGADKVAYLNLETSFNEYYRTCQENYQFELQTMSFQDRLKVMEEEYQETMKKAAEAREAAEDDLRSQQEKEEAKRRFLGYVERVKDKEQEIMRFRQVEGQQLRTKQSETIHALVLELTAKVKEFAKAQGYTHVYEVSGLTSAQAPVLLVYPEELNITAEFTKYINAGHEQELADAKKQLEDLK